MSYETNDKMVSHPDHYKSGKYEVIDIIDEFTKDLSGTEAVCTANAIKYILRWKKKNGIQDVKKAIWYLQHMVDKDEERLREEHAEFDEELLKKKEECEYTTNLIKNYMNSQKVPTKPLKSMKEICEDIIAPKEPIKEVDMDKIMNPPFVDIQPIKDDTKYTKKIDLSTGKVTLNPQTCFTCGYANVPNSHLPCCDCKSYDKWVDEKDIVVQEPEKKLEPGCDRCEISECKFLEDPFMNPPYNVLWDKWKDQKETIRKLMIDKKEMQDSIDLLEDDKNKLKIKNHEIRADLKCLISNDLNNLEEIDKHADDAVLVRKWCRRAGVDVQKINDRYFTENEEVTNEQR